MIVEVIAVLFSYNDYPLDELDLRLQSIPSNYLFPDQTVHLYYEHFR